MTLYAAVNGLSGTIGTVSYGIGIMLRSILSAFSACRISNETAQILDQV